MEEVELEAAEALAGLAKKLAHHAEEEQQQQEDLVALRLSSVSMEDEAVIALDQSESRCTVTMDKLKIDHDAELHRNIPVCTTSHGSGSKSRQKLTEDEKEARRIRRVLANRESARQTIRRRQAIYEELICKAASLSQENENLKREMDLAVQEYESLRTTNEFLKTEMAKTVVNESEETPVDAKPIETEISKSSRPNWPFLIYNQSSPLQFIWPSFFQPPNTIQSQNGQTNHENRDIVPQPPCYILPCPFFFPISDQKTAPSFDTNNKQVSTMMHSQYTANSSTTTLLCGVDEIKAETFSSKHMNIHESAKYEKGHVISTSRHSLDTVAMKKFDLNAPPNKRTADAVAAAEARKRRKELTKLKNLHCREFGRG